MSASDRPQRKLRNYVLDARFQVKFTAYLVATALVIVVVLGGFLWRASKVLLRQTAAAVDARGRAAEASRELGNVALSSALAQHDKDPAFIAELEKRSASIDQQYEVERQVIERQRAILTRQQKWTWWGLVVAMATFVMLIALAGIVTTHRIVGPVYRMKRLLGEVAEGRLVVPARGLRRHDELQDLLEALLQMIERLRAYHEADLAVIQRARTTMESAGRGDLADELRKLEAQLRARLDVAPERAPKDD